MLVAAGLLTTPDVVVPSPQSMVAVKSAGGVGSGEGGVGKEGRSRGAPASLKKKVGWMGLTVSTSASATANGLVGVALAVTGAWSARVTVTVNDLSSA